MMEMEDNNSDHLVADRISDLPDPILGHILSFLPTDQAVATSILSKRWKLAWVNVHSLDFFNCDKQNEEDNMKFVRFVNRVLHLNHAGSLTKLSLRCRCRSRDRPRGHRSRTRWFRSLAHWSPSRIGSWSISAQIISWINTAITRNVTELNLSVGDMRLPESLFTCESLRSLDLRGMFSIDTTAFRLPRLESLNIDQVSFKSAQVWEKLLSGCPVLDNLDLHVYGYRDFICMISSSSLKHLVISFKHTSKLELKASSLEYLKLDGRISEIFVEKSLKSLIRADIDIKLDEHGLPNNSIVEAISALDGVDFLTLSVDVLWALSRATISLSAKFNRLVKLEAIRYFSSLQDVIQSSDNLEDLKIHEMSNNDPQGHSEWTTPIQVPRCFSNSLKKVELRYYKGLQCEHEMIRYLLKYGSGLEVLVISCRVDEYGEDLELFQEICEFPRKSPACEVQVFVFSTNRVLNTLRLISGIAGEMVYLP